MTELQTLEIRLFICSNCQYVLGDIYRVNHVTQLRVYRHAAMGTPVPPADLPDHKQYAVVQCKDAVVICDHCGGGESWYANQTAIAEMLKRREQRRQKLAG